MSYGRFVGRVGALAVALGIGIALPVEAAADSSDGSSPDTNSANGASNSSTTGSAGGDAETGSGSTPDAPSTPSTGSGAESTAPEETELEDDDAELDGGGDGGDGDGGDGDGGDGDAELAADADIDVDLEGTDVEDVDGAGAENGSGVDEVPAETPAVSDPADSDRGPAAARLESSDPAPAEVGADADADAEQVEAPAVLPSLDSTEEAVSRNSTTNAATASTVSYEPVSPAVAPAVPEASTEKRGLLSGLLSLLTPRQSGSGTGLPATPAETFAAVLQLIRRDFERLFDNQAPTATPVQAHHIGDGIVTGPTGASDPEGDPMKYKVTQAPAKGTANVDADGKFTYTPSADLAATGGTDQFVVQARDVGFRLNFFSPRKTEVPVTVTIDAPAAAHDAVTASAASVVGTSVAAPATQATSLQATSLEAPAAQDSGAPMAMAMSMTEEHPAAESEFTTLESFGQLHGSDHTTHESLAGGRTPITTEALLAYNNLREFAGLAPATLDEVGEWAFANEMTNNSQAWGTD